MKSKNKADNILKLSRRFNCKKPNKSNTPKELKKSYKARTIKKVVIPNTPNRYNKNLSDRQISNLFNAQLKEHPGNSLAQLQSFAKSLNG